MGQLHIRCCLGTGLELSSSSDVTARVERDAVSTKLWIVPRREREAYLALPERRSNQLFTQHCKGDLNASVNRLQDILLFRRVLETSED